MAAGVRKRRKFGDSSLAGEICQIRPTRLDGRQILLHPFVRLSFGFRALAKTMLARNQLLMQAKDRSRRFISCRATSWASKMHCEG
jgi:hypothetical protein